MNSSMRKYGLLLGLCLWMQVALSQVAFYVDASQVDSVQLGTSWVYAFNNLDSAFVYAQAGDTIKVAGGTYKPSSTRGCSNCPTSNRYNYFLIDTSIVLLGSFDPTVDTQNYSQPSVLSGDIDTIGDLSDNIHQILIVLSAGEVVIDGFEIQKGNADPNTTGSTINGEGIPRERGAGAFVRSTGSATFSNCVFYQNRAGDGRGAGALYAQSPINIYQTIFEDNSAATKGGAIELFGGLHLFDNVQFFNNETRFGGSDGGALFIRGNAEVEFSNCLFKNNLSNHNGGAVYSEGISLDFSSCIFSENTSADGGGLFTVGLDILQLSNCQVLKNHATNNGGGIYNQNLTTGRYTNLAISENSSGNSCGGLYELNSSHVVIENALFVQNNAANFGGGMICQNATVDLINATLYGNEADSTNQGDGLYNKGTSNTKIYNTIFDGHDQDILQETALVWSHTFVDGKRYTPSATLNTNPLFINPTDPDGADNVWATADDGLRLSLCSPLLHEGLDSIVTVLTDIALNNRIQDGRIDLGAYEGANINGATRVYVDADNTSGIENGLSWATAFKNFDLVNHCPMDSIESIWVAEGIYGRAEVPNGAKVYGGFTGIEDSLHQRDWQTHPTNLAPRFINNQDTTTFDGFTVKYVNSYTLGNAVISYNSIVRISNCEIANNEQLIYHGHNIIDREETAGIEIKADSAHSYAEITNCRISDNEIIAHNFRKVYQMAGGILVHGTNQAQVYAHISNCDIERNKMRMTYGSHEPDSTLNPESSIGGGVYIGSEQNSVVRVNINECNILNNIVERVSGGSTLASWHSDIGVGILVSARDSASQVHLDISRSSIEGQNGNFTNRMDCSSSGGIAITSNSSGAQATARITDCQIIDNYIAGNIHLNLSRISALAGGIGLFSRDANTSVEAYISDCDILNNDARGYPDVYNGSSLKLYSSVGGGINMTADSGNISAELNNNIISDNSSIMRASGGADSLSLHCYGSAGIQMAAYSPGAEVEGKISNCILNRNEITLTSVIDQGPYAVYGTGGIASYAASDSTNVIVDIARCNISDNIFKNGILQSYNNNFAEAFSSGGVLIGANKGYTSASISNNLLSQNVAFSPSINLGGPTSNRVHSAGGILGQADSANISWDVNNCTIANNAVAPFPQTVELWTSYAGGGILISADSSLTDLHINNSIIWKNFYGQIDTAAVDIYSNLDTNDIAIKHCLLETYQAGPSNIIGVDPHFIRPIIPDTTLSFDFVNDSLSNYRIVDTSIAINAGYNEYVLLDNHDLDMDGDTTEFIPDDLDGMPRIQAWTVDIGAYEYDSQDTLFVDHMAMGDSTGRTWVDAAVGEFDILDFTMERGIEAVHIAEGNYLMTRNTEINSGLNIRGGFPNGGGVPNAGLHSTTLSYNFTNPSFEINAPMHTIFIRGVDLIDPSATILDFELISGELDLEEILIE